MRAAKRLTSCPNPPKLLTPGNIRPANKQGNNHPKQSARIGTASNYCIVRTEAQDALKEAQIGALHILARFRILWQCCNAAVGGGVRRQGTVPQGANL